MKVAFDYSLVFIHVPINQGRMQLKENYTLIIILMTLDIYHNGILKSLSILEQKSAYSLN